MKDDREKSVTVGMSEVIMALEPFSLSDKTQKCFIIRDAEAVLKLGIALRRFCYEMLLTYK